MNLKELEKEVMWCKSEIFDMQHNTIPNIKKCFIKLQHHLNPILTPYGRKVDVELPKLPKGQKRLNQEEDK